MLIRQTDAKTSPAVKLIHLIENKLLKSHLFELYNDVIDVNHPVSDNEITILTSLIDILSYHQYEDESEKQSVILTTLTFLTQIEAGLIFIEFCRYFKPCQDLIDNVFLAALQQNKIAVFEHFCFRTNNENIYLPSAQIIKTAFSFAIEEGDYLFVDRVCETIKNPKRKQSQLLTSLLIKTIQALLQNLSLIDDELIQLMESLNIEQLYNFYCVIISFYKGDLLKTDDVPLEIHIKFIKIFLRHPSYLKGFVDTNLPTNPFKENRFYQDKIRAIKLLYESGIFKEYFDLLITPNIQLRLYYIAYSQSLVEMQKNGILNAHIFKLIEKNPKLFPYLAQVSQLFVQLDRLNFLKNEEDYKQFENYDYFILHDICKEVELYLEKRWQPEEMLINMQALLLVAQDEQLFKYWRRIKDDDIQMKLYKENLICIENLIILENFNFNNKNTILSLLIQLNQLGLMKLFHHSIQIKEACFHADDCKNLENTAKTLLIFNQYGWMNRESVQAFLINVPLNFHYCEIINLLAKYQFFNNEKLIDIFLMYSDTVSAADTVHILGACKRKNLLTNENQWVFISKIDLIMSIINILNAHKISLCYDHAADWVAAGISNLENIVSALQVLSTHTCLNEKNLHKLIDDIKNYHGENIDSLVFCMIHYAHLTFSPNKLGLISQALFSIEKNACFPISKELILNFENFQGENPIDLANALIYLKKMNFIDLTMDLVNFLSKISNHLINVAYALNFLEKAKIYSLYKKEIYASFYHYPHLAFDKAHALSKLQTNHLLNKVSVDLILFRSTLPPLNLTWAIMQLNEANLLESIYNSKERDFFIQTVSQIQLKNSNKLINFICFMIKQIFYLEKTKFNVNAALMSFDKIDEKIQEYRKKMLELTMLLTEEAIREAASYLLSNPIILQPCNWLGFSLFNSTDVKELTDFINKHVGLYENTQRISSDLI